MLELNPIYNQYADYDYEYVVHVRPYITIVNKIPSQLILHSQMVIKC